MLYDQIDEKEKAKNCYKKALELNPRNFDSLVNLGHSYQTEENYAESKIFYAKANEVNEERHVCYGLAISCWKLK